MFTSFDKALAPILLGGIVFLLSKVGITPEMSIQDAVSFAVSAGLVWLVKNKE